MGNPISCLKSRTKCKKKQTLSGQPTLGRLSVSSFGTLSWYQAQPWMGKVRAQALPIPPVPEYLFSTLDQDAFCIDITIKSPAIQIITLILGLILLAFEHRATFMKSTATCRSLVASFVLLAFTSPGAFPVAFPLFQND